jgi:hypothetical protein
MTHPALGRSEDPIRSLERCVLDLVRYEWEHIQPTDRAETRRERQRLMTELVKAEGPALKLLTAHYPLKEATQPVAGVQNACQELQTRALERTIDQQIDVATVQEAREQLQSRTDKVHEALACLGRLGQAIVMISGTGDQAAPATKRPKRSTQRSEGRAKLIAALTKHHRYADSGCLNLEPIGNNELARRAKVDPSTASAFFNREFNKGEKKGYSKYRVICRDPGCLAFSLKALNGEFAPHDLYGARPPGEDEPEAE